jgi:5-hydroxyisourate hydrolase
MRCFPGTQVCGNMPRKHARVCLMGRLTTHVLDTAAGRPAAGLEIDLHRLDESGARSADSMLRSVISNRDGRCDASLLEGDDMSAGIYELCFHAGRYFDAQGLDLPQPPFLDVVVIRFGIADPDAHYHVPLLISPYGYSTYRGS